MHVPVSLTIHRKAGSGRINTGRMLVFGCSGWRTGGTVTPVAPPARELGAGRSVRLHRGPDRSLLGGFTKRVFRARHVLIQELTGEVSPHNPPAARLVADGGPSRSRVIPRAGRSGYCRLPRDPEACFGGDPAADASDPPAGGDRGVWSPRPAVPRLRTSRRRCACPGVRRRSAPGRGACRGVPRADDRLLLGHS